MEETNTTDEIVTDETDTVDTTSVNETDDWEHVAELIASAINNKQPQPLFKTLTTDYGDLRVVYSVTTGELLVSFLLMVAMSLFLLRWLFKAVWGR
ncbi:hypothetical protein P9302_16100 [Brevibacillus agri]|uniref:hypothetical protein n=1 Tax=Brevibacillus agri TaxID=51101 RepID=UPI002E2427A7|nr:hypothetical protein [Brevibacillus agri]